MSLINLLLIFAVVLLYVRQNRLMEIEKKQRIALSESEELMATLLAQIKEENELFLKKMKSIQKDEPDEQMTVKSHQQEKDISEKIAISKMAHQEMLASRSYGNNQQLDAPAQLPLYEQVQQLSKKGLAEDEIAKTLKKGKTEIALLKKFQSDK